MNDKNNTYESPLCTRYASEKMQYLFSAQKKFSTFRRLWTALARAQMKLGLDITAKQVKELEDNIDNIDFNAVNEKEKQIRHDVMAHIYAYGKVCPNAKGIIHLGATSCYVGDNTDIIIMRDALEIIKKKIVKVLDNLSKFADEYKSMPCLAYTHLQPAQLTTVGKRAAVWAYELLMDYEEICYRIGNLKLLGQKGAVGTQASFLELFNGDNQKVVELERQIACEMGFSCCVPVSGQTYSRKVDFSVLSALSGIAQSCSKFSNDLRILSSFKEIEEPFEKSQIGSSAMPYKRNPMRAERITALARYVIVDSLNPALTAGSQWMERTLDDSANKRIAVAEAFLAADAILDIMINVTSGMAVYPNVINKRVMQELPFVATENVLMRAVKKGGDRQELLEKLREHCIETAYTVKNRGSDNDLIKRIARDKSFMLDETELGEILKPENYIGRSVVQVDEFLKKLIRPVLDENSEMLGESTRLSV